MKWTEMNPRRQLIGMDEPADRFDIALHIKRSMGFWLGTFFFPLLIYLPNISSSGIYIYIYKAARGYWRRWFDGFPEWMEADTRRRSRNPLALWRWSWSIDSGRARLFDPLTTKRIFISLAKYRFIVEQTRPTLLLTHAVYQIIFYFRDFLVAWFDWSALMWWPPDDNRLSMEIMLLLL